MTQNLPRKALLFIMVTLTLTSACGDIKREAKYPGRRNAGDADMTYEGERQGLFGKGGGLFNSTKKKDASAGITVNAYLWRAALDTVSFMPIASADPFGGTILTDWYEAPEAKGERLKANVLILSKSLRTDALKVTLFRQVRNSNDEWQDAAVDPKTVSKLEESILTRARELKIANKDAQ